MDNHKYVSISQLINSGDYPFTKGQIRHFLTKRHQNNLQKAVRKIGKRVYLRVDLWEQWIEEQGVERGEL